MKCSVCSTEIKDNYCSECGQYYKNERISIKTIFTDLFGNIFSLEKSFFKNMKVGLFHPKMLISNYWNGYRGFYYSPMRFLTIASLFFILQISIFKDFFGIYVFSKFAQQFTLLFVFIIILSFLSFTVYFKFKKNFYEHLILNIYNVSLWSIIFVPVSMILSALNTNKSIKTGFIIIYLLLIIIWNSKIFEINNLKRYIYITLNCVLLVIIPLMIYKLFGIF
jgi:hypothetical protein